MRSAVVVAMELVSSAVGGGGAAAAGEDVFGARARAASSTQCSSQGVCASTVVGLGAKREWRSCPP